MRTIGVRCYGFTQPCQQNPLMPRLSSCYKTTMNRIVAAALLFFLFLSVPSGDALRAETISDISKPWWPSWRGDMSGSARIPGVEIPLEWGPDKHVRWRIDLPEAGNSTPAVWGDRVFVTQAITSEKSRNLMCFNRADGRLLWKQGLVYAAEERTHRDNPYASASPAVDQDLVVTSFGSAGVVAYDHDGKEQWRRDFGAIDHVWGNSSSPVIVGDVVIHYHGPARDAVLYGLNRRTGETVWQWNEPAWKPGLRTDGFQERSDDGVIGSFSTPIVVESELGKELIMSFPMELKSFDPASGAVRWTCAGLNPLVYTSPVFEDGIVVAMGGYFGNSIGVRVGGAGDVTSSHRLWQEVRHHGGISSGVAHEGHLYAQDAGGIAYCFSMSTGEMVWKARLPGAAKSWGSFVLAGDHIYTLSQAGDSVVFRASTKGLEVLARSDLGEHTNSSIAVAGNELFIRTHEALWCIGEL